MLTINAGNSGPLWNLTLSLQPMHVCNYHFTTTFQKMQPINAEKLWFAFCVSYGP